MRYTNYGGNDNEPDNLGLENNRIYFAIVPAGSSTSLMLAETPEAANANTPINFPNTSTTDYGSSLIKGFRLDPTTINTADGIINFGFDHGFQTGQAVEYRGVDGEEIGELTTGTVYYVEVVDSQQIKLAPTTAQALRTDSNALRMSVTMPQSSTVATRFQQRNHLIR